MHEVEVNVVGLEILQRGCDSLLDALVPWVVEFGGEPNLTSRNTGIDDALSNFGFIAICEGTGKLAKNRGA